MKIERMSRPRSYPIDDDTWVEMPEEVNYTAYDVAKIFPNSIGICKETIKELSEKMDALNEKRRRIMEVFKDDTDRWLYEAIDVTIPMEKLRKQIEFLQRVIFFQTIKNKLGTGDDIKESIEQAKQVPVNQFLEFDRAGNTKCLWHEEKTPSLHWNKRTNWVHCFSCGVNRTVIHVVQQMKGVKFLEAVRIILGK